MCQATFSFVSDGEYAETERVLADAGNRWIFGLYYVSQTLLVVSSKLSLMQNGFKISSTFI